MCFIAVSKKEISILACTRDGIPTEKRGIFRTWRRKSKTTRMWSRGYRCDKSKNHRTSSRWKSTAHPFWNIGNLHPSFVRDAKGKEILKRLEEPLHDLSISRTSFNWGVPILTNTQHVMYVWFDALTNYLTAIDYFDDPSFWKNSIHLIGRDILWFHAVIWPCMLFSAGIPLPQQILVHGFINDASNRKMSKSLNNVVEPFELLEEGLTSDQLRYYFLRDGSFGSDVKFSLDGVIARSNELADVYGNLVTRSLALLKKYCGGRIPDEGKCHGDGQTFFASVDPFMKEGDPIGGLNMIMKHVHEINQWLQTKAPWQQTTQEKPMIIRELLDQVMIVTRALNPFIPDATELLSRNCL